MHATRLSLLVPALAVVIGVVAFAGDAPVSRAGTASGASETPSGEEAEIATTCAASVGGKAAATAAAERKVAGSAVPASSRYFRPTWDTSAWARSRMASGSGLPLPKAA